MNTIDHIFLICRSLISTTTYTSSPFFAADDGVILANLLHRYVAKDQTKSAMNMMKNPSSMPETIPRGPFTNAGCFQVANL